MTNETDPTKDTIDIFVIDKGADVNSMLISEILNSSGQTANVSGFTTQKRGLEAVSEAYSDRPDLDLVVLTGVEGNAIGAGLFDETTWSGTETRAYVDQIRQASKGKASIVIYTGGGKVTEQDARAFGTSGYLDKTKNVIDRAGYVVNAAKNDIYWETEELQDRLRLMADGKESRVEGYRLALEEMGREMLKLSEQDKEMDYRQDVSDALERTQGNIFAKDERIILDVFDSVCEGLHTIAGIFFRKDVNPTQSFYQALGNSLLYAAENFNKPNQ
jgi:hypothetical protein